MDRNTIWLLLNLITRFLLMFSITELSTSARCFSFPRRLLITAPQSGIASDQGHLSNLTIRFCLFIETWDSDQSWVLSKGNQEIPSAVRQNEKYIRFFMCVCVSVYCYFKLQPHIWGADKTPFLLVSKYLLGIINICIFLVEISTQPKTQICLNNTLL